MFSTKTGKLALAMATVLPFFFVVGTGAVVWIGLRELSTYEADQPMTDPLVAGAIKSMVPWGAALPFFALICQIGCLLAYLRHASRNAQLSKSELDVWKLLLVLGGPFTMIPYFIRYIWKA